MDAFTFLMAIVIRCDVCWCAAVSSTLLQEHGRNQRNPRRVVVYRDVMMMMMMMMKVVDGKNDEKVELTVSKLVLMA